MNSVPDNLINARINCPRFSGSSDVFEPTMTHNDDNEARQITVLIQWINSILPHLNLPSKVSSEELRAYLIDGTVLLQILKKLRPSCVIEINSYDNSPSSHQENVRKFLAAMGELAIPQFEISELEKGSMRTVMDCLLRLKAKFANEGNKLSAIGTTNRGGSPQEHTSPQSGNERQKVSPESRFQRASSHSPLTPNTPSALIHHAGHKFHEVFQLKQGRYADLSTAKISEMMKSNSLDNAPTQSLLSVVNGILDESIERKNGEIPHRVACLLRKVVQEIERRISTQAEHLRTQNNLFKAREEKYLSRIRVLEALASGTSEETETQKSKTDKLKKVEEEYMIKLMKEKQQTNLELSTLKRELDLAKKEYELEKSQMDEERKRGNEDAIRLMEEKKHTDTELSKLKQELEIAKNAQELEKSQTDDKRRVEEEDVIKLIKEKDVALSTLKQQLETMKKTHELHCLELEREAKNVKEHLKERMKDLEHVLEDSRNRVKILEASTESKNQTWSKKKLIVKSLVEFQSGALKELKFSSEGIKHEILKAQKSYLEEFSCLGTKLKTLTEASENYHIVLAENRKMFNELQDLKGNIRVYCRIRPLQQAEKWTTIEHIGENGELVVANPSKQGKDGQRLYRFNKVYGPDSTQGEVFSDTQPLIRSVLDGYNVCIFAYGQTGSGKTYTMTGPNGATEEEWGVNYRALNDLFNISQNRSNSFTYEVGVQMFEIYNEQLRDLLANDSSQKKLGIKTISQPGGLAVPDATMHPVTSPADVMEFMEIGLSNRAVGATALNERSSRSHSVVSIHVQGKDLRTGDALQGNLHLVDLAGSERVDRSEVTGDRLREAQHINKSLSALGDVIFSLAQKSSHIPYRNSKLTQLLQTSLGGQAKTLMFVQLNPDISSYSETISTLKFAERVSGVELGAARSSKEGRDVRDLMEQVATLKDTIAKKDGEIERLQLLKDLKNVYPGSSGDKQRTGLSKHGYSSASNDSIVETQQSQKSSSRSLDGSQKSMKSPSDHGNNSEYNDIHSDVDSLQSVEDLKQQNTFLKQTKFSEGDKNQDVLAEDAENTGYRVGDREDRTSDTSDGDLSTRTEADSSPNDKKKQSDKDKSKVESRIRSMQRLAHSTATLSRDSSRASTSLKKSTTSNPTTVKPTRRWQ